MQCFLCKRNNFELIYKLKSKNILRCRNDGLFVADGAASRSRNDYKTDYYDNPPHPPKSNQSYFNKKLLAIQQLTINNFPRILDVGCGWGDFEEVLEKEKIPYLGIDVNKEAIEICKKKGLNCMQYNIETSPEIPSLIKEGKKGWLKFDAITMFQVIEHLKNPLQLLWTAKKLLKKNGVILLTTPNNDSPLRKLFGPGWSVYSEPSHYVFFNKKALEKTLSLAGIKNIQIRIDSPRFLASNYILQRFLKMYFNWKLEIGNWKFSFPIPTDPFGDLEASAFSD